MAYNKANRKPGICSLLYRILRVYNPEADRGVHDLKEVKRHYINIIRLIHTDKNADPRAKSATQCVIRTWTVLNDESLAYLYKHYGRSGLEDLTIDWTEMEAAHEFIEETITVKQNKNEHEPEANTSESKDNGPDATNANESNNHGQPEVIIIDSDTESITCAEEQSEEHNNKENEAHLNESSSSSSTNEQSVNSSREEEEDTNNRQTDELPNKIDIIDHCFRRGQLKFLIKWRGFNIRPIWVKEETVTTYHAETLDQYIINLQVKRPRSFSPLIKKRQQFSRLFKSNS